MSRKNKKTLGWIAGICLLLGVILVPQQAEDSKDTGEHKTASEEPAVQTPSARVSLSAADIPAYAGEPYVAVNHNTPTFSEAELTTESYEYYSELDSLGRCGAAYACIGRDLMPTQERGTIGQVKPSGWQTVKYDVVDGKYLYNRCHLIGYQLTGENANTRNLITGTRYLNVDGMLPFENMVADYVQETGNHVMYRVTPVFDGNNLLAGGVQMEAMSVEDGGAGIMFHVYCYNVQPGVVIDYATGSSSLEAPVEEPTASAGTETYSDEAASPGGTAASQEPAQPQADSTVIGNKNTKAFHRPSCSRLPKEENRVTFHSREEAIAAGYDNPCAYCNP